MEQISNAEIVKDFGKKEVDGEQEKEVDSEQEKEIEGEQEKEIDGEQEVDDSYNGRDSDLF